jgi:hypothetical protein
MKWYRPRGHSPASQALHIISVGACTTKDLAGDRRRKELGYLSCAGSMMVWASMRAR